MRTLLVGLLFTTPPALAQMSLPLPSPGLPYPLAMLAPTSPLAFGLGASLGISSPLPALMHSSMQMVPNLLSYQHLQAMTNPYLGGPAAANPYLLPGLARPFAPPAFTPGLPMVGQGQLGLRWPAAMPPGPSLPVFGQPGNPYLPAAPGPILPLPFAQPNWLGNAK